MFVSWYVVTLSPQIIDLAYTMLNNEYKINSQLNKGIKTLGSITKS